MKFSIKDFFSKYDKIRSSHLLKKSLMENLIFCAVHALLFLSKLNSSFNYSALEFIL